VENQRVRVCGDVRGHIPQPEQLEIPQADQLELAYARLRSLTPDDDSDATLEEIERLERAVLRRYDAAIEERDSTVPPPKK